MKYQSASHTAPTRHKLATRMRKRMPWSSSPLTSPNRILAVKGDRTSRCPTTRDDKNRDGIIDIVETNPVAGTTMVPFDNDPAGMSMVNDTFPRAGMDGSYSYEKIVSLKALEAAFTKIFPGQQLDLDRRVVFLHGIPVSTKLPATVGSLDHIPAQLVLPIACGAIKKVRN
jgi:hypothetical protein